MMNEGGDFAEIDGSGRSCSGIRYLTYDVSRRSGCEMGRCPKVCDGRFPPYRQPSPRGEGAPQGRIGHWRHASEREGVSQAGDL